MSEPDAGGPWVASPVAGDAALAQRASRALGRALGRLRGTDRFGVDGRLLSWTDNLLPDIDPSELQAAAGLVGQLAWRAVDSPTMLAVNSFALWHRSPDLLPLAEAVGYEVLRFDARCPTGVRGTPPHLDLLALRADRVVAVTTRCTEYLLRRRGRLAAAYDELAIPPPLAPWAAELARLREDPGRYRHLDAAALIKHALGLGRTFPDRPVVLLYLFWEPLDATRFEAFRRHRSELAAFARAVAPAAVRLESLSVCELWRQWALRDRPDWLAPLIARLEERYAVAIEPGAAPA